MTLSKEWNIRRIFVNNEDKITTVEFDLYYTDEVNYPGCSSQHSGIVPFTDYNLPSNASDIDIINILSGWGGEYHQAELESLHERELRFYHEMNTSTIIDKTPVVVPVLTDADVDRERDRRVSMGFLFGGVLYQSQSEDRENIAGASQVALEAIMNGAQPGDLYWHGGTTPFVWIATDNSLNPMDAQTMFNFGKAAMAHKQTLIFKARAIKDMNPIPADYATNETYWS